MTMMMGSFGQQAMTQMGTKPRSAAAAHQEAVFLYEQASTAGFWRRFWRALKGKSSRLHSLRDVISTVASQHNLGLQTVPLEEITGSEGRAKDFDVDFFPRQEHTRGRWISVAAALRSGKSLPPVDLIRVGDSYFVRDGHHRLSVARQLGQATIDAHVVLWQ